MRSYLFGLAEIVKKSGEVPEHLDVQFHVKEVHTVRSLARRILRSEQETIRILRERRLMALELIEPLKVFGHEPQQRGVFAGDELRIFRDESIQNLTAHHEERKYFHQHERENALANSIVKLQTPPSPSDQIL